MSPTVPSRVNGSFPNQADKARRPAQVAPRTWIRAILSGGWVEETCPAWCTSTHVNDTYGCLDDLVHMGPAVAMRAEMHLAGTDGPAAWPILSATIACDPYSEDPARRTPHVSLEPSQDDVIENVHPEQLAAFIRDVRAHCDRLDQVHAQLVQVVADHERRQA
ncbi:MAG: hypothetical protein JWO67_1438 [Streptosporangiaceae bacterium]|nr:hypothetical protein [Streptosporangiaceae bacterium]